MMEEILIKEVSCFSADFKWFSYRRCLFFMLVAHAPRNLNRKIPTLDELEHDVKAALPASDVSIE